MFKFIIIDLCQFEKQEMDTIGKEIKKRDDLTRKMHVQKFREHLQDKEDLLWFLQHHTYENRNSDIFEEREEQREKERAEEAGKYMLR